MEENTNYSIDNNDMDYIPEFVDIEGLQGMNSSQGMEHFMQDMNNMDPMNGMNGMDMNNSMWQPMNGMDNTYNVPPTQGGMDYMYNIPPMQGGMDYMYQTPPMQGMNNYNNMPMGGTCTEVIRCVATMCYMASVFFMQMLQSDNSPNMGMNPNPMNPNPMYQNPMGGCDCMDYTQNDNYGYPPIY